MSRYLTEVIGTFFLVFTIGLTVLDGTALAPLAIGSALMVMVYMGGHISGAHYNPAVSIAILIRGKMEARDLVPYVIAQLTGAVLASLAVYVITGSTFAPAPGADVGLVAVLLAEALFAFAVSIVVLNVATSDATAGNSYYGLAIGFTVMVGAFAVGGVSGGVFNPAVGTGPILVDTLLGDGSMSNLWIYLVGPVLGGVAAAAVFDLQNPDAEEA
jgi:aquaporin Z